MTGSKPVEATDMSVAIFFAARVREGIWRRGTATDMGALAAPACSGISLFLPLGASHEIYFDDGTAQLFWVASSDKARSDTCPKVSGAPRPRQSP